MMLTREQQLKVEENMGLVGKVIKDKVHGTNQLGIYTYDDIFQIGCMGLCKAAATDKGGCFSTYAYRLIWNSICDALIYATRRQDTELLSEDDNLYEASDSREFFSVLKYDLDAAIQNVKADAPPSIQKGIDALILMNQGYSSEEAGEQLQAASNQIRALVSKAKKYLRSCPEIQALREGAAQ